MKIINQQVEDSKHAENIQLKGYLQEKEYQQVLAESDIY